MFSKKNPNLREKKNQPIYFWQISNIYKNIHKNLMNSLFVSITQFQQWRAHSQSYFI